MVVMNFLFVISTILQIASIASKKFDTSSDESIENILFYKDYRPKNKEPPPLPAEPLVLQAPPKQPECIPRMCCSMSCTNTCGQNEMSPENPNQRLAMQSMNAINSMNGMGQMNGMNQMNGMSQMLPMNHMNSMNPMNSVNQMQNGAQSPRFNPPFNRHNKKKKLPALQIPSRRSNSFTREHIKSLISQDQDIKKILKDLVRVTMKKVDLLEMIKTRRAEEMKGDAGLNNDEDNNDEDGKEL